MSATTANGIPVSLAAHDVDAVVTVLREQVTALCAQVSRAPSAVRVACGDVSVEVQWPEAAPASSPAPVLPDKPTGQPIAKSEETRELCAHTVGVFYRAPEPGAKPFVSEGDLVTAGQQVAIIEAMKLMIPVEADRAGRVVEILVDNGTSVEHGQPLMVVQPR